MNTDLDAQVAVIMGWTAPPNESGHRCEDIWWRDPEGSYSPRCPAYSTDWAAAGELWEWLVNEGQDIQADHLADMGRVVSVTIARKYGLFGRGTFPEALCRAALATVGARKESEDNGPS